MNSSVFRCLHYRILLLVHLEAKQGKVFTMKLLNFSRIVPYNEDFKPLATPEEAAEH